MRWRVCIQEVGAMGHVWFRMTSIVVEAANEQEALEKAHKELPGYGKFLHVEREP